MIVDIDKIGLIPAAGYDRRLGEIHGSNKMIPVDGEYGIEPVCHSLIRQFKNAGIDKIVLVTRNDKIDLLQHIKSTLNIDVQIQVVYLKQSKSTLDSICAAYGLIREKEVYLGFPDMIMSPTDAMSSLSKAKDNSSASVILGAFPANDPAKVDMIDIGPNNELLDMVIKDPDCTYRYAWIIACWMSDFTEYLNNLFCTGKLLSHDGETYIGSVFLSYLKAGHGIDVWPIERGEFIDIGTPDDLASPQINRITLKLKNS